ncbi:MAG: hypothetical protein A3J24_13390 [Deltaproteobacteria bacterium RIFCSPLOWO2_02_FULL_53_8]|nr:MAG: hypothetical protein A3J24_13390 [Deltaproteobacteria bacterium RIFCSPLOWO2_02_FULL_53_8]
MSIEVTGWPVVHMHFAGQISAEQFEQWLHAASALLERQQPFAIVTSSAAQLSLPDGYRGQEARWYKANKAALARYCVGLARLASCAEQYTQLNSAAMHGAWPCPYFVSLDLTQANAWAAQQVAS